jgi:tetratricopeptide (TPR) repeat protein
MVEELQALQQNDADDPRARHAWGLIRSFEAMAGIDDHRPQAENNYRTALIIFEELALTNPDNLGYQGGLFMSHTKIGDAQHAQGNLPAALTSYRAAFEVATRLAKAELDPDLERDLSVLHYKIGDVQRAQGNLPAALTSYRAAFKVATRLAEIANRLANFDPITTNRQQRLLWVLHFRIGHVQRAQGNLPAALTSYQAAFAVVKHLMEIDTYVTSYPDALAKIRQEMSSLLSQDSNLVSYGTVQGMPVSEEATTSEPQDLSGETDLSEARRLYAKARELGFTAESAIKTLEREAKDAARETTGRAKAKPRPDVALVVEGSALVRLRSKYAYLLAHTRLPEKISTKEDAQLAGRLVETYRALWKHELAMGLKPTPKGEQVKEAHRLRVAFYRKHKASQSRRRAGSALRGATASPD